MKIVYILRAKFGISGGAASFNFPLKMSQEHEVLVIDVARKNDNEKVVCGDKNVSVKSIHNAPQLDMVRDVYTILKKFQPDIVHVFQSNIVFSYLFYLKPLLSNTKWIIDFRSPFVSNNDRVKKRQFFYSQFYVSALLTHSMPSLKTNLPVRLRKAFEIPPGIDLGRFHAKTQQFERKRRFLYIGSISKIRNLQFLLLAFGNCARELEYKITLDIYGDGNDLETLERLVEEHDFSKIINLKGVLPQNELLKIIADYDFGIAYVPYKSLTTAPSLKSLEYAAAKIAILATDTVGHKEYNKKYGFDFKLFSNNEEDFKKTLGTLVKSPYPKDSILKNYEAVKQFNWNDIVNTKLLSVYKKVLKNQQI